MPTTDGVPPEPKAQMNMKAILDIIRTGGELEEATKAQGEALSKVGQLFQKMEKTHNGNRAAIQLIVKMKKMSADKRNDFIRTLEPLMVELGYTLDDIDPGDMVAQAEKKTADDDGGPAGDGETGDDAGDVDQGAASGAEDGDKRWWPEGQNSGMNALAASRARLNGAAGAEPKADPVPPKRAKPKLGIVTGEGSGK